MISFSSPVPYAAQKERNLLLPDGHPPVYSGKIGVLVVNLGTPDATDYWSMRRYLKEFLSDRRVIEKPSKPVWWLILNLIILTKRPKSSGEAYEAIWNHELDESPLRTITRSQTEKLRDFTSEMNDRIIIDWAMRYGTPSLAERIRALQQQGCERLLVMPLYPQYAAATTATVNDVVFDTLKKMRWQPALRTLPPYHDDPAYIEALAKSMLDNLARLDFEPECVIASYHGLPKSYFDKGDPYHCHCHKTTRLLREYLDWPKERLKLTFQSRFGSEEWLQPYTDETIKSLAKNGMRRLAVITPGFSADCVETLEEIGMQNREFFEEAGGEHFAALPCLNDTEQGMALLKTLLLRELSGWI